MILQSPAPVAALRRATEASAARHLLGIDDLDDDELLALTDPALPREIAHTSAPWGTLGMLFEQPSLRTASGFAASGLRVGLVPVPINARGHAVRAGIDLADELQQLCMLSDCVVVRTHDALDAAALRHCRTPVINAGDGSNEHPTQALIDATTLRALGAEGRRITLMGNLRDHRTQHSLVRLLRRLGMAPQLVSPVGMGMPACHAGALHTLETNCAAVVDAALAQSDFIYLTPTRYWDTPDAPASNAFRMDLARAQRVLKPSARLLHPLPRLDELDASLDASSYNGYHRQLALATAVRTRLMAHLLEG